MGIYLCCLCCLTSQKAICLEISLAIINGISFLCFLWDFGSFPWKYIRKSGQAFFIIDFFILLFEISTIIYCIILRQKNLINSIRNYSSKILSYIMLGTNPLGIIFIIISEYIIINDLNNTELTYITENYYNPNIINQNKSPITNAHWAAVRGGMSLIEISWILSLCFWIVDNKLIVNKTDGPYTSFIRGLSQAIQINNAQRQVQVVQDNNGLIFLGYDEFGRPIYGQAGYMPQQQGPYPNYPNMPVGNVGYSSNGELNNRLHAAPNPIDQDVSNNNMNRGNNHAFFEKPQVNNNM